MVLSYKGQRFYLKPLLTLAQEIGMLVLASKEVKGNIKYLEAEDVARLVAEFNPAEPADKLNAIIPLNFDPQTGDFSGTVYYNYTTDSQTFILNITAYSGNGNIAFSNFTLSFGYATEPVKKGEVKFPEPPGTCDTCQTGSDTGYTNVFIWGQIKALESPDAPIKAIAFGSGVIY